MKNILALLILLMTFTKSAFAGVDPNLVVKNINYPSIPGITEISLRTGYYLEDSNAEFKGCVLYLQGLSDSSMNHIPLYKALSTQGYRTLFFDYFGQGGSDGSMNHTRIIDLLAPSLQISNQAKYIWNYYSNIQNSINDKSCEGSKKRVIGWSTGGLATYGLANEKWANAVVLIAPGIYPQPLVGEAARDPQLMLELKPVITLRTLTTAEFTSTNDPHLDPISPNSPSLVPLFATNLVLSSVKSHFWKISNSVKGLVFLSGPNDTYVYSKPTEDLLAKNASHFTVVTYKKALHEIDNEAPAISSDFRKKTVEFFNAN
jgi:alpha-beta hydrolase superfamily lysophospholipase